MSSIRISSGRGSRGQNAWPEKVWIAAPIRTTGSRHEDIYAALQHPGHVLVSPRRALPGPDVQPVKFVGNSAERATASPEPPDFRQHGLLGRFRFDVAFVGGQPEPIRASPDIPSSPACVA